MPRPKYKNLNIRVDMTKVNTETILSTMPQSINLCELSAEDTFELEDIEDSRQTLEDKIEFEVLLMNILMMLDEREKLIFLYQIMRDDGYRLDHASCAKTLHINLRWYMDLLNQMKTKIAVFLSCSPQYNPEILSGLIPPKQDKETL